jgi:predicted nucleotidyltransferase
MRVRIRDFIETVEGLYFAVNTYSHPNNKFFAFLRYVPYEFVDFELDKKNIREIKGKKYVKMAESQIAYKFLEEKFSKYLFYDETINVLMHAIPKEDVKRILSPKERLKEIVNEENNLNELEEKCRKLALILEEYGVPIKSMGVSGSLLLKLNNKNSDIDFVIYGKHNHKKGREALKLAYEDNKLKPLSNNFWKLAYEKRIKDGTLTYEEFVFYEKRKYNRGIVDNTMFDLLFTREWEEIDEKYGDKRYKNLGFIKIEGKVLNDDFAFDNPAVYKIECYDDEDIKEVVSFTHTYAGQCFNGEEIVARGKLEEVIDKNGNKYKRVVVGTTREAFNEYIKLKK